MALWDMCADREREEEEREEEEGRERERALLVALGKVYVTLRQEPGRQTLAEDVTDFLSAVSGLCQLSVSVAFSRSLHIC